MSTNQLHGKFFEDTIKACFPGSSDHGRQPTDRFDIEARFDPSEDKLPTSIKTTSGNVVCLADAHRFLTAQTPFRMLIGRYRQEQEAKVFFEVREYLITKEVHAALCQGIDPSDIETLTRVIRQKGVGEHHEARAIARQAVAGWKGCHLRINPKIDSKDQRRLQCSVRLSVLDELVAPIIHAERYGHYFLPIRIGSTPREFMGREQARSLATPAP